MLWLAIVIGVILGFLSLLLPRSDKLGSNNMMENIAHLQEATTRGVIGAGLGCLLPMAFFTAITFLVLLIINVVFF